MLIEVRKKPVRLVNNSMKLISKMLLFSHYKKCNFTVGKFFLLSRIFGSAFYFDNYFINYGRGGVGLGWSKRLLLGSFNKEIKVTLKHQTSPKKPHEKNNKKKQKNKKKKLKLCFVKHVSIKIDF